MCQQHQIRCYRFMCGCAIYNFGEVLGIKYAHCNNYDPYTNTIQFRDSNAPHTERACCLHEANGNETINLSCWAHAKLYRIGQPLSSMTPVVYEDPCEWANSGDFVNDDAFKRTRDQIYAQMDVKIMLELYEQAFRSGDPKGQWELVESEIAEAVEERDGFVERGAQRPMVVAPTVLRPAVLEYL